MVRQRVRQLRQRGTYLLLRTGRAGLTPGRRERSRRPSLPPSSLPHKTNRDNRGDVDQRRGAEQRVAADVIVQRAADHAARRSADPEDQREEQALARRAQPVRHVLSEGAQRRDVEDTERKTIQRLDCN